MRRLNIWICMLILVLQASDARLAGLNTLKYSVWFSRGAGLVLGIDGFLILLPGACAAPVSCCPSLPRICSVP